MPIHEISTTFRASSHNKVAFLIDATTLTSKRQSELIKLVSQILFHLPAAIERSVYFLGNSSPYRAMAFEQQAVTWFQENRQRASLISPILESLEPDDISDLVLLGADPVFDLDDWLGSPFLSRMKEICLDPDFTGHALIQRKIIQTTAEAICLELHDPVVEVEISGPGFMPTAWDHDDYSLSFNNDKVRLVAKGLNDYSIRLNAFIYKEKQLEIAISRASGDQFYGHLRQVSPLEDITAREGTLTPIERAVFRRASQRQSYSCPICRSTHSWDHLYCLEDRSILGKLIYPSLAGNQRRGFFVFQKENKKIKYRFIGGDVLHLENELVAIREGNKVQIYRYDERRDVWVRSGKNLELYHPLEGGSHVIFL